MQFCRGFRYICYDKLFFLITNETRESYCRAVRAYSCGIGEEHDIASENPEEVARMAKLLGDKLREWKSPMPVIISTGQTVPMPDEIL